MAITASPPPPSPAPLVSAAELADLPAVVRRYFAFMGVAAGKPRLRSLRTGFTGQFRLGLKGDWQPADGWTFVGRAGGPYRLFEMHMKMWGWAPVRVHDYYRDGKGGFAARLFGLVPVADAAGPELDVGELVTYLNDAILGAPDLLLGGGVAWREVDAHGFDVTLEDAGTRVSARVTVDDRGAPTDFSTTDRFFVDPTDAKRPPVRTRWTTPVAGWTTVDGRAICLGGQAVWHFPEGSYAYGELRLVPGSVRFDAPVPR